jgi:CLIP-associating protein 1/2
MSAQVLLHRLLENQYPLFAACSKEREMLDVLFCNVAWAAVGEKSVGMGAGSAGVVARKAVVQGVEAVLGCWARRADPVLGFNVLCGVLAAPPASLPALTTALRAGFPSLLARLPSELVLDDFLPKLAPALAEALRAPTPDARLAATTLLKKINDQLRRDAIDASHERIFHILHLERTDRATMDVLMYYFSKE